MASFGQKDLHIFGSCGRYVQGFGALDELPALTAHLGKTFYVIASKGRIRALGERLSASYGDSASLVFGEFGGESSTAEAKKHEAAARKCGADAILGTGGGKALDTAKAVAQWCGLPVVIIPTVAASDAPTSSTALLYNEEGTVVETVVEMDKSPEIVLVDTEIILKAPVRFLVAGMGDALSTCPGARVAVTGYKDNYYNGLFTQTSYAIAKTSYELLMKYGRQAKIAAENGAFTDAFNTIVEVNTLMSGLGFENNGSGTDHAFFFGMLALPRYKEHALHGEGVAFSTCCQLVLEGADTETLDEVFGFCRDVGLPVTFKQLGLEDPTKDECLLMAEDMMKRPINHPFPITAEKLAGAYLTADAIGKMYLAGGRL